MTSKNKTRYIDGFLLCVPKTKLTKYRTLSRKMGKIMKEYGVLEYRECVADDMKNIMGIAFDKVIKTKKNEVVVFSWIAFKSKAHRTSVNKKVMQDPRVMKMCSIKDMPFDCKRMAYGGFKVLVDAF
jgi:uncharacterized protein YbaA (DUF1428 family)